MSLFRKIFNSVIFLLGSISGTQFLRFMFWIEVMTFIHLGVYFLILSIHYVVYNLEYNLDPAFVRFQILGRILVLSFHSVMTFFLWKGIKEMSKSYLRAYLLIKVTVLLVAFGSCTHLIVLNSEPSRFWSSIRTPQLTLALTLGAMDLYAVFYVVYYHNKLDSPLMNRFKERLESLKDSETVGEGNELADARTFNGGSPHEGPWVAYDVLKSYIISPLDIILDSSRPIGEGMFGIVYKGLLVNKDTKLSIVAKAARNPSEGETFVMILNEVKIMIHAGGHRNIVKFLGVSSDARLKDNFIIINEYCALGCLESFLVKNRQNFISLENPPVTQSEQGDLCVNVESKQQGNEKYSRTHLMKFASQITAGMEHLATKKIIHGDLATRNVLLTTDLQIKITDFGMSRRLYNYQLYYKPSKGQAGQFLLPWRWMSIEAMEDLKFSEKSDVWSFGITLWEIFSLGDLPFKEWEWTSTFQQRLRGGMSLRRPSYATLEMYKIMEECWNLDSSQRPTFTQLKSKLLTEFQTLSS